MEAAVSVKTMKIKTHKIFKRYTVHESNEVTVSNSQEYSCCQGGLRGLGDRDGVDFMILMWDRKLITSRLMHCRLCTKFSCFVVISVLCFYRFSAGSELDDVVEDSHSYTNVEFARESCHGTPRRMKLGGGQDNNRYVHVHLYVRILAI